MEINISLLPEQSSSNKATSAHQTNLDRSEIQVHQLPCNINHNGKANIENYFLVNALDDKTNQDIYTLMDEPTNPKETLYETFFRGRRLIGKDVILDDEYEGCIFKESLHKSNEEMRNWETSLKFNSFMVWEHNTIPQPSNNRLLSSLDWLEVSNAVHEPAFSDNDPIVLADN
ncbi:11325_t:CDS:2 [Scutellospora calospora]|uniref:11325_t:CDS:1 n=1 Tax=Scutellospora calospora TaxID=85575 RepID=A0ACA9KWT9_9GLOM|nr:11325_t:CDS:2 [Scutellospora calospora]